MFSGLKALDRIIRGESTQLPALASGKIDIPTLPLMAVLLLLGMISGACTGSNAVVTRGGAPEGWNQMLASTAKIPLLFGLTLLITFPSLYVFNALVGSRLRMAAMLKLLVMALAVMMAVVASLGPIVAFFAVSTTSYPFMKLLNVAAYAISGVLGLGFLLQTLHRLSAVEEALRIEEEFPPPGTKPLDADPASGPEAPAAPPLPPYLPPPAPGALDAVHPRRPDPRVGMIFRIWVIVFGLVGAQMAWVLRPFIGNPDQPFTFFRKRESHFFQAVWDALVKMFAS